MASHYHPDEYVVQFREDREVVERSYATLETFSDGLGELESELYHDSLTSLCEEVGESFLDAAESKRNTESILKRLDISQINSLEDFLEHSEVRVGGRSLRFSYVTEPAGFSESEENEAITTAAAIAYEDLERLNTYYHKAGIRLISIESLSQEALGTSAGEVIRDSDYWDIATNFGFNLK